MLARFVQSADHLARQLDSAAAISAHRWPLAPELRALEWQGLDVRAIAAGCGEDGVRVDELTAGMLEHLEPAVRAHDAGDLDPWRRSREEVRGIVAVLRESLVEPQLDGEVATRAAPAGPPPTPALSQGNVDRGQKGEKAEKASVSRKGRGRNKMPIEEGAPFRAAFWMHDATDLIPDDQHELRSAIEILGADPRPQDVFRLLQRHGLTIMLSSVRNRVPLCWPRAPDGRHAPSWEFADYAVDLNAESFARTLRRHAKQIESDPDLDRHSPAARADLTAIAGYTPASPHGPTPQVIRRRAIISGAMAAEEALSRVNAAVEAGRDDPGAWDALRQTMVERMRMPASAVDELLASRDADTVDRVAAILVETRRRAGDDGDCDPDGRLQ